ncbi:DUF6252 family protein [Autumnicola edwardsiae]|uniref:DUF6252 family protein n=1 Tax=Autumnicola edwardsiae TaxID=3075594 RepID=A0ABU3CW61_9FLAO|nr:DUF6252 family protein [Zunongwangia sp. F297]MDT0650602.1 DUF6252 family protein [Zunongwangia sp. F297]
MKTLKFLIVLLLFNFNSCSKQDDCDNPLDCLPPATQTGAGTIGCLVDGKPFTPGGNQLGGPTQQVFYQFVDGEYHFGLFAINKRGDRNEAIGLNSKGIILENSAYTLSLEITSQNATYKIGAIRFETTQENTGEIIFTKFDENTNIVSGTFWFDAVNEAGEVVEIREGRFDMKL